MKDCQLRQPLVKNDQSSLRGKIGFLILGLGSLFWLIFRSGREPSRLQYPCQKIAASNGMAFLAWLGSILSGHFLYRKNKNFGQKLLILSVLGLLVFSGIKTYRVWQKKRLYREARAQGVVSKVVRIRNNSATDGVINNTYFRQPSHFNQSVINNMLDQATMALTGAGSTNQAWSQLFSNVSGHDYQSGEIIAIKINNNNDGVDGEQNPLYQTTNALIRQLVAKGVPQGNIYLYDCSRNFTDDASYFPDGIHAVYSQVKIYEKRSASWNGGSVAGAQICGLLANATYLINMPLLRTHAMANVTCAFKNHLGSTNAPDNFHGVFEGGSPDPLIELNAHQNIGGKTALIVVDGLYVINGGGPHSLPDSVDNTLLLSMDPVAVDTYTFEYLDQDGSYYLPRAQNAGLGSMNYQEVFCNPNCPGTTPGPSATPTPTSTPGHLLGNIDLQNGVNANDALVLFSLYRKQFWLDIYAPDPDRDGLPTLADFGYVLRDWGK